MILLGIGAWHLRSYINALKLLINSNSPTIICFRCEDLLVVMNGLLFLLENPQVGAVNDVKEILEQLFKNRNNYVFFIHDKLPSGKTAEEIFLKYKKEHEFTKYLERLNPLFSTIGMECFNWSNFHEHLLEQNSIFSAEVIPVRVEKWDDFVGQLILMKELSKI